MTGLEIIGAISSAISIVKDAPAAVKVLKDLGVSIGLLEAEVQQQKPAIQIDESEAIGILTKGLITELNDLTREYHQNKKTWDQVEREKYQKRVAAKACELLSSADEILKEVVKSYDVLKKFFCRVAGDSPPA